jgi:type I restriction enzyme M protein
VDEVTRERAQSFLTEDHIEKIVSVYRDYRDVTGFAQVVSADAIRANKANLSIPLYVRAPNGNGVATGKESLKNTVAEWERSSAALRASMEEMFKTLKENGVGR